MRNSIWISGNERNLRVFGKNVSGKLKNLRNFTTEVDRRVATLFDKNLNHHIAARKQEIIMLRRNYGIDCERRHFMDFMATNPLFLAAVVIFFERYSDVIFQNPHVGVCARSHSPANCFHNLFKYTGDLSLSKLKLRKPCISVTEIVKLKVFDDWGMTRPWK